MAWVVAIGSLHAVLPIAWFAVHVHDGYDVDVFRLLPVDDGVGKCFGEVTLPRAVDATVDRGRTEDFNNEAVHFPVEAFAKFGINFSIVFRGLVVFLDGFGVKFFRFHKPTVFRMMALVSSKVKVLALPLFISS